ncbi:type 1 glutamine amidotransferase domain-containing protein [Ancylomarina euxinus]|uniref:Type 1 glutamine amidotransferase domain-containing protein n=1 Tax=Ancylomarina euxinus TaxID=2283627 RepID=A0A425Y2V7_9BACT|nr:type 1 glutamine amidotransferase domain-containing protein [Ancylomarina euxinus]MCZ4694993.1 type 1 glutamine amidotransferase domain-containing protein [Ancylomarina euxinus]MUP14858.1 type 1 glutamine amidotransferase domain-containing protein [Ancylomarina euxinus]RRG22201.1 type 1 glutamine amidotransferase domain-containing protein [Ancylomarina euxinus]
MLIKTGVINILFVLTSHSQMGDTGHKTGFWIEEFANPYYALADAGVKITIATPKGGVAPIDPTSNLPQNVTEDTERFSKDEAVQKMINETIALADINFEDYDAVFYPGGHGPLWDLAEDKTSAKLIQDFYAANKPVAFVCHAPAALKHVKDANGEFLVKGKKVTGFTNEEEEAVQLTNVVPFLVEDMLKEHGGIYSRGKTWEAYAVQDGNLITGQNPASSALVAEILLKMLQKD